jgi:hypothetical protein
MGAVTYPNTDGTANQVLTTNGSGTATWTTQTGLLTTTAQTIAGAKTFSSNLTAPSFIVDGGTSTQFLKADGTVDATTYVPKNTSIISIGQGANAYPEEPVADATIAIGIYAGAGAQKTQSIAIGTEAAYSENAPYAIAIGYRAGFRLQNQNAIAIGKEAGREDQFPDAISIGSDAGYIGQHDNSIAIGKGAGNKFQWTNAIAIGNGAGAGTGAVAEVSEDLGQAADAIAIGTEAGNQNQGQDAIAIGRYAGQLNQASNSIILNASGSALNSGNTGFFVNPIRFGDNGSAQGLNHLYYDATTKEIKYSTTAITVNSAIAYEEIKANSIYTGSLSMSSDKRLKSNIVGLPNSMHIINKLNPVSYKKKDSISSTEYKYEEMGFIAQELQKVLPMLVIEGTDKDKTLSVNYISLIPLLTKAIQEQQTQIEEKGKQTDELKKQLNRQQKEIDELRELIKGIKK